MTRSVKKEKLSESPAMRERSSFTLTEQNKIFSNLFVALILCYFLIKKKVKINLEKVSQPVPSIGGIRLTDLDFLAFSGAGARTSTEK